MIQFSQTPYALGVFWLLVAQVGCAQTINRDLAPPPGGETVSVIVKVPQDLVADKMRVMYRSAKCPITRSDGSGERYEVDGAKAIDIEPQRQGLTDMYEVELARDGGGTCQWKLSNVTFGVHYENTAKFGREATYGHGGTVIAVFDKNPPQQLSMDGIVDVSGDILIQEEYFPWLIESFIGGHDVSVVIYGRQNFYTYRSYNAKRVLFEPTLHGDVVVRTVGVKSVGTGEVAENIYPDGFREFTTGDPSLKRLREISSKQ